jgi:predicted RNA-binding protein with PUA-like domain
MSNYIGYRLEDNIKRKANNTGDNHYDCATNTNTKRWTTTGSAMSDHISKVTAREIKKNCKVKIYTKEEIAEFEKQRRSA